MANSESPKLDFKQFQELFVAQDSPKHDLWYVLVAVVLECTAYEDSVPELWLHLQSTIKDFDELVAVTRRLRESLLKTGALAGFPKGINCLSKLHNAIKSNNKELAEKLEKDSSLRDPIPAGETQKRGEAFFERIYGQHTMRVIDNMRLSSGGDLDQFALYSVYGELMAETKILDPRETGLLEFVACYASMAVAQAKGHMFGSRNLGASKEDLQSAIKLVEIMMPHLPPKPFDPKQLPFLSKVDQW